MILTKEQFNLLEGQMEDDGELGESPIEVINTPSPLPGKIVESSIDDEAFPM